MPYLSTTSYLDYFWKFYEFPDWEVPYFPLYPQNLWFWDLKNLKFEQILSIFYSFLEMSKIAQYFDYIDLRPPQGVSKSEVFLKRPPPKPPPSSRCLRKAPKTTKNGEKWATFRASGPKHPYFSRSKGGPPHGASSKMAKKGPKMTQNRPFLRVVSPPKSIARGLFGVRGGPLKVVPNLWSKMVEKGPPRPQIEGPRPSIEDLPTPRPQKWPFLGPSEGVFLPPLGEGCRLLGLHFEGPFK